MTIKEQLISLGMKESEFSSWCSDLYVKKTPVSEKFMAEYEFPYTVTTFKDNIDGVPWYEIRLGYTEYYREML